LRIAASPTLLAALLLLSISSAGEIAPTATTAPAEPADEVLSEITISAPEARYVAPTRRDRIGRIWAPVMINGQGPFKLVLDTGATHSAIIASVARRLGLPLDAEPPMQLRGVTGSAVVPVVKVDSLEVGDLLLKGSRLPIVIDALGGADGVLGTEGLADMRIRIDFRADQITITRSHDQPAPPGFITLPVHLTPRRLPLIDATIGGIRSKAILDTGGQASIGNNALRDQILRRRTKQEPTKDEITGATADVQQAEGYPAPLVQMGALQVQGAHVTFGDMRIFEHWKLTKEPVMLIGMDTLGLLDTMIIDYKRKEMQLRLPAHSRR
jgi:predicted aspartyl protease